jgi:hypothetical protein
VRRQAGDAVLQATRGLWKNGSWVRRVVQAAPAERTRKRLIRPNTAIVGMARSDKG